MSLKSLLTIAVAMAGVIAILCMIGKRSGKEPIVKITIDDPGMEPFDYTSDIPQSGAAATPDKAMSIVTATKGNWS